MSERIYMSAGDGALEEPLFSHEDELQTLIAEHPETRAAGSSSRAKIRIAPVSGAAVRWSLDHLIIDQDAVPTLAEPGS